MIFKKGEEEMENLTLKYYIKEEEEYKEFKEYNSSFIGLEGLYARQLCHYLILNAVQYKVLKIEIINGEEILTIEKERQAVAFSDELINIDESKIKMEFRPYYNNSDVPLVHHVVLEHNKEVIRYLLKDAVEIEGIGQRKVNFFEWDDDRKVYVAYFEPTKEDVDKYIK